jgi:hypothetical protein
VEAERPKTASPPMNAVAASASPMRKALFEMSAVRGRKLA